MPKNKNVTEKDKKLRGKQEMRGYLSPEAKVCYQLISEQTNWSDSIILSNAVRLTYAAYKNGQIGLLNSWLKKTTNYKRQNPLINILLVDESRTSTLWR